VIEVIRLTILEIDNFNGFGNKKVKGQEWSLSKSVRNLPFVHFLFGDMSEL
jgi:hypothetical protein